MHQRSDFKKSLGCIVASVLFVLVVVVGGIALLEKRAHSSSEELTYKEVSYDGYATLKHVVDSNFVGPVWWSYYPEGNSSDIEDLYKNGGGVVAIVLGKDGYTPIGEDVTDQGANCWSVSIDVEGEGLATERQARSDLMLEYCKNQMPETVPGYIIKLVGRGEDGRYLVSIEETEVPVTYSFTVDNR